MKFALQRCCGTSIFLKQYESATDAVLEALGVERVEIKERGDFRAEVTAKSGKRSTLTSMTSGTKARSKPT